MVEALPHIRGEATVTHHLRPSELLRLLHSHNRRKFGHIFGTDRAALKSFWEGLFGSPDGQYFKRLHPTLRDKSPKELDTSIPFVAHEDAAPFSKKLSVNLLQWGPLLVRGSDIESRFVHHAYISK